MMGSEPERAVPQHHPEPEDLLEYASGASPQWLSLMVACHLTLCERCRREVALLDEVGGALLELSASDHARAGDGGDARGVEAGWFERAASASAAITPTSDGADAHDGARAALPADLDGLVPRPLLPYLAEPEGRFRFLAPGIRHVPLRTPSEGVQLRLVKFRPGFVIPRHGHEGLEWLLILDGDIGDSHTGARYGRGDVCRNDVDKEHSQDVSPSEPCVALVANLGPLIPRTLLGRVLKKVVKI